MRGNVQLRAAVKKTLQICLLVILASVSGACGRDEQSLVASVKQEASLPAAREYVGSDACRGCHADQFDRWRDSHHFKAMMTAGPHSVAIDFEDARFDYFGVVSEFYSNDSGYFVRTDNERGVIQEFEISHTFGVQPLQQYLVVLPDGRRQALGIAADTRGEEATWFHLYADEQVAAGDRLHWMSHDQNWNFMCADCHSTDLRKNYDAETRSYATTWEEMNVGCEACHGPASQHIDLVAAGTDSNADPQSGFAFSINDPVKQTETCARCHSRRGILAEGFEPGAQFMDHYRPALLAEALYHADGQILEEVYVYGSFLQSKMFRRGVACSDCHNTHDAGRDIGDNATCTRCHQTSPPAAFPTLAARDYAGGEHHFHPAGSAGSQCVACHMPARTYMTVDVRHDHSLRIPRPDLSVENEFPNACNACHDDKSAEWAAAEIETRYPAPRRAHYGPLFLAGRSGEPTAGAGLAALARDAGQSGIVRGTALSLLANYQTSGARNALVAALNDPDPLVRLGALQGMESVPLANRWLVAGSALQDPVLAIRMQAVTLLAPARVVSDNQQRELRTAIAEYVSTQALNFDRAPAHASVGYILGGAGDRQGARAAYQAALDIDPGWAPALVNLADLNREEDRDEESDSLFAAALDSAPDDADVRQAYGMWLIRTGRAMEAVAEFEAALALAPDNSRHAYIYAVALNSTGQSDAALSELARAHEKFPRDADILVALSTMHRDRGEVDEALRYAKRLFAIRPADVGVENLVRELSDQR